MVLRGSCFFLPGSPENEPLKTSFSNETFPTKTRYSRSILNGGTATKLAIAGRLSPAPLDKSLNKMEVGQTFPLRRVLRWRLAFMRANRLPLKSFVEVLRSRLLKILETDGVAGLGEAKHLLTKDIDRWFLAVAELHITCQHQPAPLSEALHVDGSASAVHLGLTLAGDRVVRFIQETATGVCKKQQGPSVGPDVNVAGSPGHVYIGGVTGARHQVSHPAVNRSHSMLLLPGSCSVTVMMRTCVFADNGRRMYQTPSPRPAWDALTACVRNFLASGSLVLPTLEQCLSERDFD